MTQPISVARAATLGFSAFLVGIGIGRFGYPAIIPALVAEGWTTPFIAHVAAASNLAGYILGALAGIALMRAFGPRATIIGALWVTVASFLFSAVPLPGWLFAGMRFVSGVTGAVLMVAVAPMITASVDPARRGRATGLAFSGIGCGIIASGLLVPLLARFGLGAAWLGFGAVLAAASALATAMLPRVIAAPAPSRDSEGARRWSPALIGLACVYASVAIGFVPHTVIFVDYVARVLGRGLDAGGLIWGVTGCGAIISPILLGRLADRIGFAPTMRLTFSALVVGTVLAASFDTLWILAVTAFIAGSVGVTSALVTVARLRELVDADRQTTIWAQFTVVFGLGQSASAYATSGLLAWTGNYPLLFILAGMVVVVGLVIEMATAHRTGAKGPPRALNA